MKIMAKVHHVNTRRWSQDISSSGDFGKIFCKNSWNESEKQGMLALTFADKADYDKIREDDVIDILVSLLLHHRENNSRFDWITQTVRVNNFPVNHTYNETRSNGLK